jgi:hypothetical protein
MFKIRIFFSLFLLLVTFHTQAQLSQQTLTLPQAEHFAREALAFRVNQRIMGNFTRDSAIHSDLFEAAEGLLRGFVNDSNIRVEQIFARPSYIRFEIVNLRSGKKVWMSSHTEDNAEIVSSSQRLARSVHLIIEDEKRWEDSKTGRFVTLSQGSETRITTGQKRGPFSLSIFGASTGDNLKLGVAGSIELKTKGGWSFLIRAELATDFKPNLSLTEGRYSHSVNVSFQVEKVWGASQFATSAGVNFNWTSSVDFNLQPSISTFISVGRIFTDAKGARIGLAEIFGIANLGVNGEEWMIGMRATFIF